MFSRSALLPPALCLVLVSACTAADSTDPPRSEPPAIKLPQVHAAEADFLYHRFNQRLLAYDFARHRVEEISDAPYFFQFEFPTPSQLYTAGDTLAGGYSVVDVHDREITKVLSMSEGQGIFPLATSDGATFFLRSTYDDHSQETNREVVRLDDGATLVPFTRVTGLVDSGAILKGRLHYSVYYEAQDTYDVFSVPVDDPGAEPRRELSGLESGRLYTHRGRLLHADAKRILGGERVFECADLCYFHDEHHILVRIRVGEDSDLELDVIHTPSGKVVGTVADGLDYRIDGDRLTVYREGDVVHVELPS